MAKKSDTKRQHILSVAAQAFQEFGFERTSMSEICARVGGSKATLYNYFSSKDELFFEVMSLTNDAEFEAVFHSIDPAAVDIAASLSDFGIRWLTFLYSPNVQVNRHLAISVSGRTDLGRLMYERGVLRGQDLVADLLRTAMSHGRLQQADPVVASRHLLSLLESELMERFLFQLLGEVGADEIKQVTARAIDVFMAAYGQCNQPEQKEKLITKVLIVFCSMYGHTKQMADAIAAGVHEVEGCGAIIKRVPETLSSEILGMMGALDAQKGMEQIPLATVEDLVSADAIIFGSPTRFGCVTAQMRQFLDATGGLQAKGALVGKVGSVFTSSATQHGGQVSTILGLHTTLLHHGMVVVGLPYAFAGQMDNSEITVCSPYGASTVAGTQGERTPSANELAGARFQGAHVAKIAKKIAQ